MIHGRVRFVEFKSIIFYGCVNARVIPFPGFEGEEKHIYVYNKYFCRWVKQEELKDFNADYKNEIFAGYIYLQPVSRLNESKILISQMHHLDTRRKEKIDR